MLIRVESGLPALALTKGFVYLTCQDKNRIFRISLLVNVLEVLLFLFINYPRNAAEKDYLNIRPYQYYMVST